MKIIPLTKGYLALVDSWDFLFLSRYKWYAHDSTSGIYAARYSYTFGIRSLIYMHRLLLAPSEFMQIDHINRNTLDNRRNNLRIVHASENNRNRVFKEKLNAPEWFNKSS
mgnify:CR=1 FL=1